jgi:hypothetical protein
MRLIPSVPAAKTKRNFMDRLRRVLYVSGRNWCQTVNAIARDDKTREDHLWRRMLQHERAKRRCL